MTPKAARTVMTNVAWETRTPTWTVGAGEAVAVALAPTMTVWSTLIGGGEAVAVALTGTAVV